MSSRLRSRIAPPGGRRETAGTGELVSVTCLVGLGYASYEVASTHFRWIYEAVLFAAIQHPLQNVGTPLQSVAVEM